MPCEAVPTIAVKQSQSHVNRAKRKKRNTNLQAKSVNEHEHQCCQRWIVKNLHAKTPNYLALHQNQNTIALISILINRYELTINYILEEDDKQSIGWEKTPVFQLEFSRRLTNLTSCSVNCDVNIS